MNGLLIFNDKSLSNRRLKVTILKTYESLRFLLLCQSKKSHSVGYPSVTGTFLVSTILMLGRQSVVSLRVTIGNAHLMGPDDVHHYVSLSRQRWRLRVRCILIICATNIMHDSLADMLLLSCRWWYLWSSSVLIVSPAEAGTSVPKLFIRCVNKANPNLLIDWPFIDRGYYRVRLFANVSSYLFLMRSRGNLSCLEDTGCRLRYCGVASSTFLLLILYILIAGRGATPPSLSERSISCLLMPPEMDVTRERDKFICH